MCITERSMPGSRPEVGSSRKSSEGLVSSSRATLTRLRWPPERLWMGCPTRCSRPSSRIDLVDPGLPLGLRGVLREAQLGGVGEGAAHGQLGVQDVVLRYEADALAQLGVVAVQVAAVVQDRAPVGGALAGQGVEQRGLSGAAGSDDGEQALLADGEGDPVEERLAALVDGDRQVLHVERDLAGVDVLLELVADQAERRVADADDVARVDAGAGRRAAR